MSKEISVPKRTRPCVGELLLARDRRTDDDRFGVGDYVTRDGTDVHRCKSLNEDGSLGEFECIVAPAIYEGSHEPWITVGEIETNVTRRYEPVSYRSKIGATNPGCGDDA